MHSAFSTTLAQKVHWNWPWNRFILGSVWSPQHGNEIPRLRPGYRRHQVAAILSPGHSDHIARLPRHGEIGEILIWQSPSRRRGTGVGRFWCHSSMKIEVFRSTTVLFKIKSVLWVPSYGPSKLPYFLNFSAPVPSDSSKFNRTVLSRFSTDIYQIPTTHCLRHGHSTFQFWCISDHSPSCYSPDSEPGANLRFLTNFAFMHVESQSGPGRRYGSQGLKAHSQGYPTRSVLSKSDEGILIFFNLNLDFAQILLKRGDLSLHYGVWQSITRLILDRSCWYLASF